MASTVRNKLVLSHLLAMAVLLGTVGFYVYRQAEDMILSGLRDRVRQTAVLTGRTLRTADLDAVTSANAVQLPVYQTYLSLLRSFREADPEIANLYILRRLGKEVEFVVDADDSDMQALPGTLVRKPDDLLLAGFSEGTVDQQLFRQGKNYFLSGYAPVAGGEGRYLVGLDLRADQAAAAIHKLAVTGGVAAGVALVLAMLAASLIAADLTSRIRTVMFGCRDLGDGRLQGGIDIESHDEVGRLATAFNTMAEKLRSERTRREQESASLREARAGLERQLEQRTRELAEVNLHLTREIEVRHAAENAHRDVERRMRQTQKLESLGAMAGGVAHDFNNLLVGIIGNAELGESESSKDSPFHEYFHEIGKAGRKAADLTSQMLAYSGKTPRSEEKVNINHLIREMETLIGAAIDKRARREDKLDESIPEVKVDADQFRQVLLNLVTNASEALTDGEGVIRMETGVREVKPDEVEDLFSGTYLAAGRYLVIRVSDTGSGIPAEHIPKVFDPFFTTRFTGRGLGLAAVMGIVRAHHGTMTVQSEVGKGTTFSVLVPIEVVGARKSGVAGIATSMSSEERKAILVADDDEAVRQVASAMLKRLGVDVLTAKDGVEAIEIFKTNEARISGVLLDVTMPRMSGVETLQELRNLRKDLPVVLMSGYSEDEALVQFAGKTIADFLQKPFTLDAFRNVMGMEKEPT